MFLNCQRFFIDIYCKTFLNSRPLRIYKKVGTPLYSDVPTCVFKLFAEVYG